jgi:Putative DNA-binding domain
MRTLEQLQRWMQRVIMNPDGVAEGVAEARSELDTDPEDVESVVTRSRALPAMARLEVYRNAYFARLLECLREEFPVLAKFLDEEIFDGFALAYLEKYPSRSYTLANLATNFPRYLAESRPQRTDDGSTPDWADFLIDLATLEWTFSDVFDGPGSENEPLLDGAMLQSIPPEALMEARFVPVPCLRFRSLHYPVQDYHAAVRRGETPDVPAPMPTYLAVTRRDYVVRYETLSLPEYQLLGSLADGISLGPALVQLAETADLPLDQLGEQLHLWFRDWGRKGLFRAIEWADASATE